MNIQINSLTNANIYIDGIGLLGRAEEIEIANPKHKMIDYKDLGMAGTAELWAGVEKLESKIKWASFDADTLTLSTSPFQTHSFQARGKPGAVHQPGPNCTAAGGVPDDGNLQRCRQSDFPPASDGRNHVGSKYLSLRAIRGRSSNILVRRIRQYLRGRRRRSTEYFPIEPWRLTEHSSEAERRER